MLHQVQSSEELKERLRKVKEAGLIPERDERTIKQVKKGEYLIDSGGIE